MTARLVPFFTREPWPICGPNFLDWRCTGGELITTPQDGFGQAQRC